METLSGFSREFLASLFEYDESVRGLRRKVRRSHQPAGAVVGSSDGKGYLQVCVLDKNLFVHRIVYFLHTGEAPSGVDHKDRDKTNNTFSNLRPANQRDNSGNTGLSKHNTSGFKGVSQNGQSGKWHAQIKLNGKQTYLGRRDRPEEAALLYDAAARTHFGEFAVTNYGN